MTVIPARKTVEQVNRSYITSSRPTWVTRDSISEEQQQQQKLNKGRDIGTDMVNAQIFRDLI